MRLLLDTHTFLWYIQGDPRTSARARQLIEDPANQIFLSIASLWEIAIKVALGKLALNERFDLLIPREIKDGGFLTLAIDVPHTIVVSTLPHHHRDPFDRMLIAQAMAEGMPIVGADPAFDAYGVTRLW